MNIDLEQLRKYKGFITHNEGYRLVYYYENYHEVPRGLYSKKIENFNKLFNLKDNEKIETLLDEILKTNEKILGVAIYNVDAKCILRKNKKNIVTINNSEVYKEELIYDYGDISATEGYRIVYYHDNDNYSIGPYCNNIEGFMFDFCDSYPIIDDDDIPKFISIDDLLNRYLKRKKDALSVLLYKIDGTVIAKKDRTKKILNYL